MNIEELEEELSNILVAGYELGTDKNGQLIIYTGLRQDDDGELHVFESDDEDEDEDEDEELDPDFDPDFEPLEDEEEDDED
jgi:hypothetical protein